ncbi:hypothetical protein [Desulfurobacterium sp.]
MARIALVGSYVSLEKLENGISQIERMINQKGKAVDWWSYPIKHCKEVYKTEKPFWFYLYCNGRIKARYRVIDFLTKEGNEGVECPRDWEAYLVKQSWKEKKKISQEEKTWIFKTWFLIDKVERLKIPLTIANLKGFCNQDINTSRLRNSFLYIFNPLFSREDLKKLIRNFIEQSIDKNNLEIKNYKAFYKDLEIKVSFGRDQQATISWMAFLNFRQEVSKSIYPVILFDRENCLVVAYGVSETEFPDINWDENVTSNYPKISNTTCECDLTKIKEKYGNSYLKKCFEIKDNIDNTLDSIVNTLDKVINDYKKIFSKHELREKTTINTKYSTNRPFYLSNKLYLVPHIINSFYNALKTKGFVILAGLSGTGKTKIFEEFVKCFPELGPKLRSEKWIVFKHSNEKLLRVEKEEIEFNKGKIKVKDFIDSINESLGYPTARKVYLKIADYYTSLIPVIEKLKEKTHLINARGINNHLATYIACIFGFEVIESDDAQKLNLKQLDKHLKIIEIETETKNNLFFAIRPDFKDTKSLLGFYNPLKETYHSTPLLEFILRASKNYLEKGQEADPFFVLFDEMNLARVEYYFADFLSILETKRFNNKDKALKEYKLKEFIKTLGFNSLKEDNFMFTSQSIKLHSENLHDIPQEVFLPPNLYFVGTVNIDETTYMFSPKVLDRSFTIEFDVGSFSKYLKFLKNNRTEDKKVNMTEELKAQLKKDFINEGDFASINKEKVKEFADNNQNFIKKLEQINSILKPYNLHFGYRVFDEIMMFLHNSQNSLLRFKNLDEAFDVAIKMKVLPKFNGTRQKLWEPIIKLLMELLEEKKEVNIEKLLDNGIPDLKTLNNKTTYKHTAHKLFKLLHELNTQGFSSFI